MTRKGSWEAVTLGNMFKALMRMQRKPWSLAGLGDSLPWMDDEDWGFLSAQKGMG